MYEPLIFENSLEWFLCINGCLSRNQVKQVRNKRNSVYGSLVIVYSIKTSFKTAVIWPNFCPEVLNPQFLMCGILLCSSLSYVRRFSIECRKMCSFAVSCGP